jgi:hypothetical protein
MFVMIPGIFKIFLILPIFLLIFAIIALIVSFFKLGSKRPWFALIAVSLILLLFAPAVLHIPGRHIFSHRPILSVEPIPAFSEDTKTAIWLPGIEDEFEANVYPSMKSAVRGIGSRIDISVRKLIKETDSPLRITLFQEISDRGLILELKKAIQKAVPEATCAVEDDLRNLKPNEVGVTMWVAGMGSQAAPWARSPDITVAEGNIEVNVFTVDDNVLAQTHFIEKPWVEDFSSFSNTKSNGRFIIARSADSCMTEAEANRQAVENACKHITTMLDKASRQLSKIPISYTHPVNSADIFDGDFVLDRFVQGFEGTAGRIWRQALLVDVSTEKLTKLAHRKAAMIRATKKTWARMSFSIFGLIILITVVYAFLNAATKGYYVWSLRIAGMVLFLVAIIFFLL